MNEHKGVMEFVTVLLRTVANYVVKEGDGLTGLHADLAEHAVTKTITFGAYPLKELFMQIVARLKQSFNPSIVFRW